MALNPLDAAASGTTPEQHATNALNPLDAAAQHDIPRVRKPAPLTPVQRANLLNWGDTGVDQPKDAQGKKPRPNPLREVLPLFDVPLAYEQAGAVPRPGNLGDALKFSLLTPLGYFLSNLHNRKVQQVTNDLRKGGPSLVSERDVMFRKGWAQRVLADHQADANDKAVAAWVMEHPYAAAAADMVAEFTNPANLVPGGIFKTLARLHPAVADAIAAASHVQHGLAAPVTAPLARGLQAVAKAGSHAKTAATALVDRYTAAGLPQRGGKRFVSAGMRGHAAPVNAAAEVENHINEQFAGLTSAQANEVGRLMDLDQNGQRIAQRNVVVPEPKRGPSLAKRAAVVRLLTKKLDAEQVRLGLTSSEDMRDTNTYVPLRDFGRPRFASEQQPQKNASELGDVVGLGAPDTQVPQNTGGRFKSNTVDTGRSRGYRLSDPAVFAELHPEFDLPFQLKQHYVPVAKAIANEEFNRSLSSLPSINPDTGNARVVDYPGIGVQSLMARMPLYRAMRDADGNLLVFGQGVPGREAATKYIGRTARQQARSGALADPQVQALAKRFGLQGRLGGTSIKEGGVAAANARRMAAKQTAADVAKTNGPLQRVTALERSVQADAGRSASDLQRAIDENRAAAKRASNEAYAAGAAAPMYEEDLREVQRLANSGAEKPLKNAVVGLARQLRDEANTTDAPLLEYLRDRKIRPDWVWRATSRKGGKWELTGEWADVPKAYLDLSNKPKHLPTSTGSLAATELGDADDIASELENMGIPLRGEGDEGLRRTLESIQRHTIADHLDEAEKLLAQSMREDRKGDLRGKLAALGMEGESPKRAIERLRGVVDDMRALADKSKAEYESRVGAHRAFAPAAYASVGAHERTAKRLGDVISRRDAAQQKLDRALSMRVQTAEDAAKKRREINEVARAFKSAYRDLLKKTLPEVREHVDREVERTLLPRNPKSSEAEYVPEKVELIGSPSGQEMSVDRTIDNFRNTYRSLPPSEHKQVRQAWQLVETLNRLSRGTIVALPMRHVWNLSMHALASGLPIEDVMRALTGDVGERLDPAIVRRAAESNASVAQSTERFFDVDQGYHSTFPIAERAKLAEQNASGVLKPLVGLATRARLTGAKAYNGMSHWLFGKFQRNLELSMFDKFTREGMSDADAAMKVREAILRSDNESPLERKWMLDRVFYFYHWMRTAIPFWLKHGVIDPRWWTAPVAGVRTLNEYEGYDDPSKPFAVTLGQSSPGEFRRATLPIPQSLLGAFSAGARAPLDAVRGRFDDAGADISQPVDYVAGHANPLVGVALDAIRLAGAHGRTTQTAPFNLFHTDANLTPEQNAKAMGFQALQRVFGPAEHLEAIAKDPLWGTASYLAGAFIYDAKSNRLKTNEKAIRRALVGGLDREISKLRKAGMDQEADALAAQRPALLQRAQTLIEAAEKGGAAPSPAPSGAPLNPLDSAAAPSAGPAAKATPLNPLDAAAAP